MKDDSGSSGPRRSSASPIESGPSLEELRKRSDLLDVVLAGTQEGLLDWQITANTIQYSPRWKALLGFEPHEVIDDPRAWRELTHPEDLPAVEAMLQDHLEAFWPFEHTFRMRHTTGDWRWMLARGSAVRDATGVPVRIVLLFQDVTDKVNAERAAHELATALNAAGEGIFGLDLQGCVRFANPAARAMLGYATEELLGQDAHALFHAQRADGSAYPASACPMHATVSRQEPARVIDEVFWRKDGNCFPVEYTATPMRREDGRVTGAVVTFRDVTSQRELERQLLQAQKLETIGQLASGVAHEINTPMQYIGDNIHFLRGAFEDLSQITALYDTLTAAVAETGGHADLIARVREAEAVADLAFLLEAVPGAIASAEEGVARVREIVYALKEFAHPAGDAGFTSVDLNRAIETTVTVSRSEWKLVAEVRQELDPALPAISCNGGQINQVLINLIVNAAHAIEAKREADKGVITIRTRTEGAWVIIEVVDTGCGIPPEIRHRVFDPFFTTKEVGKGTGQGLSVARGIVVNQHKGEIDFHSQVDVGTTFIVRLPRASQSQ